MKPSNIFSLILSVVIVILVFYLFQQKKEILNLQIKSDQDWTNYKINFSKHYANKDEEIDRYENFKLSDEKIKTHNLKYSKGEIGYKKGYNEFSDMSFEEFNKHHLHPIKPEVKNATKLSFSYSTFESTAELSYQRYCLPPLHQGNCGSCWAFAAAAQVEVQLARKYSSLNQHISPQYILDCSNGGDCVEGYPNIALDFLKSNGIVGLNDYPYTGTKNRCNYNAPKLPQKVISSNYISLYSDEEYLKDVLRNIGPVVVFVEVQSSFNSYEKGVYWETKCSKDCSKINHAVLLVGYGTHETSSHRYDYWLVKNSWGPDWGESGYIRMLRKWKGLENNCGIACFASYAIA